MTKLLSITLALALLSGSATAAMAHGRHYGPPGHRGHYAPYAYDYGYRKRDNTAAAVGIGLLAFGLIATLAVQNNARAYGPPPGYYGPPPPSPTYGYGY